MQQELPNKYTHCKGLYFKTRGYFLAICGWHLVCRVPCLTILFGGPASKFAGQNHPHHHRYYHQLCHYRYRSRHSSPPPSPPLRRRDPEMPHSSLLVHRPHHCSTCLDPRRPQPGPTSSWSRSRRLAAAAADKTPSTSTRARRRTK